MRLRPYILPAAALSAAIAFDRDAFAETVDVRHLTVAATWRAQPSTIEPGGSTTFKLSLKALGGDGTTAIRFGQSVFSFASGSVDSAPTSASLTLAASNASAGKTMSAMLAPLSVQYFEDGVYTATMSANDAPISWKQDGVAQSGSYSLNVGTTLSVGSAVPTIESASVPVMIGAGQGFDFAALADAGAMGTPQYQWDFDYNGTFSIDSDEQNPNFSYASAGTYTGMLRVLSESGYTPFEFKVNVLGNPNPVPLPAAVWGGLGLVAAVGVVRARGAMRSQRNDQF